MSENYIIVLGTKIWKNFLGAWHRIDGPAIILHDNDIAWWINGRQYHDNKSFQRAAKLSDEDMLMINLKYGDVK